MKKLFLLLLLALSACKSPDMSRSVLHLTTDLGESTCTGWTTNYKGKQVVITNKHCIQGGINAVKIDNEIISLVTIGCATFTDLCMLDGTPLKDKHLVSLNVSMFHPAPREKTVVCGYGLGMALTCTQGEYAGTIREFILDVALPAYYTNTILPGNSGSPVFDAYGDVVGVAFASGSMVAYRTLAVSLNDLLLFLL